ncbi:hypothetical protein LTR37_000822 [Vermiconidia calcicola]|uniref:Uncharacterized protein n=1 Tax=Vermiconidia calcicola TaxID=1690605 RepID=A0ACC3NXE2_9PEZI|nr:hypothetical protein LTR37_000822 [Vermiconidia calcicola]
MTPLTIPEEFQAQLVLRENDDRRTNAEILESLGQYRPIASEKNVWAFWHSGLTSMPQWCQHNVVDWVRMLGPSWTVRILDSVPDSLNNALKYLDAELLTETYVRGTMDGPYKGPHAADLLRGACLWQHGGVFMDVGNLLIRHLDRICWNQLEDPSSPFRVSVPWMYGITMANHFVAARKGDPFIKHWHDLFTYLWKDRTNYEGLIQSPLLAFAQELTLDDSRASKFHWEFSVSDQTVFEYVTQVVCWMRICMLEDPGDGRSDAFNGAEYWQKHVLIWDVLPENWGAEETLGFVGQKVYERLSEKRDADPETEEYKEAYNLTWRLLTKSSMQKITHGKNLTASVHLGTLWDENPGKDCEPGTFAGLLRHGTVHFEQTRPEVAYVEAPKPPETLKKGVFEP